MDVLTAHIKKVLEEKMAENGDTVMLVPQDVWLAWKNQARLQALLDATRMLEAAVRDDLYEFEMQHGSKG